MSHLSLYVWPASRLPAAWPAGCVVVVARTLRAAQNQVVYQFCDFEIDANARDEDAVDPKAFRRELEKQDPDVFDCDENAKFWLVDKSEEI